MKRVIWLLIIGLLLSACSGRTAAEIDKMSTPVEASEVVLVSASEQPTETPFQPATLTPSLVPTETPTLTPSSTITPSPTNTPTPTLTPTWIYREAGLVEAPILLYHHVEGDVSYSRYYVSVPDFQAQMQALHDWGYTVIPISLLLETLIHGGELPEKPIVITFDDGNRDIYENAFPIMQEFGFPGGFYIVANRLHSGKDIAQVPELKEMVEAGWEIGSHGYTHTDLTLDHSYVQYEIQQSKLDIEKALDIKVETFAYPFGTIDPYLAQKVHDYGYRAGMGLGTSWTHTWGTLFYLERIEIYGDYTVADMAARLPWKGDY
jgi:peptidoglycan/xylan/chitin deacetylase (PgdA/CDA1 family)